MVLTILTDCFNDHDCAFPFIDAADINTANGWGS